MLRGVNLGSHHRIGMDSLRSLYESLKLRDPRTYVQSGNVVFKTDAPDLPLLANRIENAIERVFGFHAGVVLRTPAELRTVVARNPFSARPGIDPAKLLVHFLMADPGQDACDQVRNLKTAPEELYIDGRELYIYFPYGMGRSKLSLPAIERVLNISGTGRNWNTVTKLLELAESLEAVRRSALG